MPPDPLVKADSLESIEKARDRKSNWIPAASSTKEECGGQLGKVRNDKHFQSKRERKIERSPMYFPSFLFSRSEYLQKAYYLLFLFLSASRGIASASRDHFLKHQPKSVV